MHSNQNVSPEWFLWASSITRTYLWIAQSRCESSATITEGICSSSCRHQLHRWVHCAIRIRFLYSINSSRSLSTRQLILIDISLRIYKTDKHIWTVTWGMREYCSATQNLNFQTSINWHLKFDHVCFQILRSRSEHLHHRDWRWGAVTYVLKAHAYLSCSFYIRNLQG